MKSKRWIAVCMTVFLLLGMPFPCIASDADADAETEAMIPDTSWYENDKNLSEYEITTAEQLIGFSRLLASGKSFRIK